MPSNGHTIVYATIYRSLALKKTVVLSIFTLFIKAIDQLDYMTFVIAIRVSKVIQKLIIKIDRKVYSTIGKY